jgi:hypothetical protein
MKKHISKLLLYLSNNEKVSKKKWEEDEVKFDVGFLLGLFISIFLALICWLVSVTLKIIAITSNTPRLSEIGSILSDGGWIFIAIIFFIEAYDSLRHNRSWHE